MKAIYDRIDTSTRILLDCDNCELNVATVKRLQAQIARLERELHDTREALHEERGGGRIMTDALIRAESWAALWKRAATINRHDRAWGDWHLLRAWCANLSATPLRRALRRALGIP